MGFKLMGTSRRSPVICAVAFMLETRLHRLGVIRALEAKGFEPGDDVEIGGVVFELDPG